MDFVRKFLKDDKGFAIILIPVVFVMAGLFLANVLRQAEIPDYYLEQETQAKMDKIMQAVASYASRHYRVPCPARPNNGRPDLANPAFAEPFGFEAFSGVGGVTMPQNCGATAATLVREGLVPYATLGLNYDDVIDGWGNFITYAISPAFAEQPQTGRNDGFTAGVAQGLPNADRAPIASGVAEQFVHANCRTSTGTDPWVESGKNNFVSVDGNTYDFNATGSAVNFATHPRKARFCCPAAVGTLYGSPGFGDFADIRVNHADAGNTTTRPTGSFGQANAPAGFVAAPVGNNTNETVTVLIISYGIDGFGSFQINSQPTPTRKIPNVNIVPASSDQWDNFDALPAGDPSLYTDKYRVLSDISDDYFDDILMYRTQYQLMEDVGLSCLRPYD